MVDIYDPNNPVVTGSSPTSGIPYDIQVVGDFAYVADGDNGLTVFLFLVQPLTLLPMFQQEVTLKVFMLMVLMHISHRVWTELQF